MDERTGKRRGVKTSETIFGIIETLQERDGSTVTEVADELGMANSTAYEHLRTLVDLEYLVEEDGEYNLGLKFLDHGTHAKKNYRLSVIAQPIIENLAEETQEVAWILVEEHGLAVCLCVALGKHAVPTEGHLGRGFHMHYTAGGKAMLAHSPVEHVHEVVDRHGLTKHGPNCVTDLDELLEELEEVRERGYAFNDNESTLGVRAVGAPIIPKDSVEGAISLAGPAKRFTDSRFRENIPNKLRAAANELELKLKYET